MSLVYRWQMLIFHLRGSALYMCRSSTVVSYSCRALFIEQKRDSCRTKHPGRKRPSDIESVPSAPVSYPQWGVKKPPYDTQHVEWCHRTTADCKSAGVGEVAKKPVWIWKRREWLQFFITVEIDHTISGQRSTALEYLKVIWCEVTVLQMK